MNTKKHQRVSDETQSTRNRFHQTLHENKVVIVGFLVVLVSAHILSGGSLLNLTSIYGPHVAINAWKIFAIDFTGLNPLQYDEALPLLGGGQFISVWDTPVTYLLSFVLAKILFFVGPERYLTAVKLVTLLNYAFSYVLFYLLLRSLRVNKPLSFVISSFYILHRSVIFTLTTINLSALWALLLPLYFYLKMDKNWNWKTVSLLSISLSLSFLVNPYYGFFATFLLSIPLLIKLGLALIKNPKAAIVGTVALAIPAITLLVIFKGPDIYKLQTQHLQDPEGRDYTHKQVYAYRPWWHLITPAEHPLNEWVGLPIVTELTKLREQKVLDYITLWTSYTSYNYYISVFTLLLLSIGSVVALITSKVSLKLTPIKLVGIMAVIGMVVFTRGDMYVLEKHVVFPWYRLHLLLPFTSFHYYSHVILLFVYLTLALLLTRITKLPEGSKVGMLLGVSFLYVLLGLGFFDVIHMNKAACVPYEDKPLTQYLKQETKKRMVLQLSSQCESDIDPKRAGEEVMWSLPIQRDGRYYQVYTQAPIYAPNAISYFDNYVYPESDLELRTLESVFTDKNNEKLKKAGVEEVILFIEGADMSELWNSQLKNSNRSSRSVEVFEQSIVVKL